MRRKSRCIRFGLQTGKLGPEEQFFIDRPYALELCNLYGTPGDEILAIDAMSGRLVCWKYGIEKDADADWPMVFYPLPAGQESTKRDLVIGDFDGDGRSDIVVSDRGAAELVFYKQNMDTGLAEPAKFPAFSDIDSLSVADIDGKGKAKLGVLSVKEKAIGLSEYKDGRLTFPQPVKVTGEPVSMELADVDSDGHTDCAYVSKEANDVRNLRVIYSLADAIKQKPHKKKALGKEADENESVLELKKLAANPDGIKVLDVDNDGLQDILIFVKYESPILVRQTKKRIFEVVDSPNVQASLIKDATLRSIAAADVDEKSGRELLVAQKNFARSLIFSADKGWSIIDQYNAKSTENNISAVSAFRLDGKEKGRPAVLLLDGTKGRLQILKAGEDKTYRFEKEFSVDKWGDAEHLKMLFAPLTGSNTNSILLFDGDKFALISPPAAGFKPATLEKVFSYETKIKDGVYGNVVAGDINGDGKPDIIMVEYKHNNIEILATGSDGKPISATRFKVFEEKGYREEGRDRGGVEPRELKVADVTGDGKNDLIVIIHDRVIIYPQD